MSYKQFKLNNGKVLKVESGSLANQALENLGDAIEIAPSFFTFVKKTVPLMNQTIVYSSFLSMAVDLTRGGNYKLDLSYIWSLNATNTDIDVIVLVDGIQIYRQRQEGKDSAGLGIVVGTTTGSSVNTSTDQRLPQSYHDVLVLTSGVHVIDIQFRGTSLNQEAVIYQATMSLEEK